MPGRPRVDRRERRAIFGRGGAGAPQCPVGLLDEVEPAQRHLHTGAGEDGLDSLRLVLANAAAGEVRTTAAPALRLADAPLFDGWESPRRVAAAHLPVHPAWSEPGEAVGLIRW